MNFPDKVSTLVRDPRPVATVILMAAVILFLISSCSKSTVIKVNPEGFAEGIILNIGYTLNGNILVTTPEGKVLQRVESDNFDGGSLRALSGITIAAVRGSRDNYKATSNSTKNSLLEMILPSAQAGHIPGYPNDIAEVSLKIDGDYRCHRFNITNYPPTGVFLGYC